MYLIIYFTFVVISRAEILKKEGAIEKEREKIY